MERRTRYRIPLVVAALLLIATPHDAPAAVSVGAGADYASGPGPQSVRDALGYAQTTWGRADVTVALARFNSSQVGVGTNGAAAVTWAASPKLSLQLVAGRAVGEDDYRASRILIGPVFPFAGGTWGVSYSRVEDTFGPSATGFATEVGLPLSPTLLMTGRGSLASVEGGGTNVQGSAGLIWGAAKRVLLVGELGLGRDATALPSSAPAQGGVVWGRDAGAGRDYLSGPALSIGIRYVIH